MHFKEFCALKILSPQYVLLHIANNRRPRKKARPPSLNEVSNEMSMALCQKILIYIDYRLPRFLNLICSTIRINRAKTIKRLQIFTLLQAHKTATRDLLDKRDKTYGYYVTKILSIQNVYMYDMQAIQRINDFEMICIK